MKILFLNISNILSIESASIQFEDSGLVLVEGWNFDDGRANGAGKTAIFNALSYGLFDDLPRKITASEILRDGAKNGYSHVGLEVDGDTYEVIRSRPKGVVFKVNGVDTVMSQAEFESKIRLSYQQFLVTAYSAQDSGNRFIQLNDSGKKDFLLKLMNLDDIAKCKKLIDTEIKQLNDSISKNESTISQNRAKLDAYKESLVDVKHLEVQISDLEQEIATLNSEVSALRSVVKPRTVDLDEKESVINDKLNKVAQARVKRSYLMDEYRKLTDKDKPFDGEDTCSECGTQLDMSHARETHNNRLLDYRMQAKDLKSKLDVMDAVIAKDSELKNALIKARKDRASQTQAYDVARERASQLAAVASNKTSRVDSLKESKERNERAIVKCNELNNVILACESHLSASRDRLAVCSALSSLYSPTGVAAYVLDSAVNTFNDCVSEYIDMIWPNASYTLKSYKENKDGDVVAKFSEELLINGKDKSIGSLSGGENRALSLAIDFAVMDVIFKNFNIYVNPTIMDEPFNGLDSVGREVVIELLEKLSLKRQILVVDHVSEAKAMFSKVIRVEKRNGVSAVV